MPRVKAEGVMRVVPGLSSFADDPASAGASLRPLFDFARTLVPEDARADTPLMLLATGGVRELSTKNPRASRRVLASCVDALRAQSSFQFSPRYAYVLPGSKEGLYAWVAANYAGGTLGEVTSKHLGVLELGGASLQARSIFTLVPIRPRPRGERRSLRTFPGVSLRPGSLAFNIRPRCLSTPPLTPFNSPRRRPSLQVTFEGAPEEDVPSAHVESLTIGGMTHRVYTHSALGLGQESAMEAHEMAMRGAGGRRREGRTAVRSRGVFGFGVFGGGGAGDPCAPRGKKDGGDGNFTACREAARRLLGVHDACPHASCGVGRHPRPFQPTLRGRFIATENFHHTARFLGLPEKASVADVASAGEEICAADWDTLVRTRSSGKDGEDELRKYCFSAAFIAAALGDAVGLREETKIAFRRVLLALVPIRLRSRGARRFLRTFSPVVSLRPGSLAFNHRPLCLSIPNLTPLNSTPTSLRMERLSATPSAGWTWTGPSARRCRSPRGAAGRGTSA
jgi:apyrase